MNANRRQCIYDAAAELEAVKEEEQEAFDNMPENLQQSAKGEVLEAAISNLDEAVEYARRAADGE